MKILAQRMNSDQKSGKNNAEKSQTNLGHTALLAPTKSGGLKRQNSAITPARGAIGNTNSNNSEIDDFEKMEDRLKKQLSSQLKNKI